MYTYEFERSFGAFLDSEVYDQAEAEIVELAMKRIGNLVKGQFHKPLREDVEEDVAEAVKEALFSADRVAYAMGQVSMGGEPYREE